MTARVNYPTAIRFGAGRIAEVSARLADALDLTGDTRRDFLMAALKTTTSERRPTEYQAVDPQLFNPVTQMLAGHKLTPVNIRRVHRDPRLNIESPTALKHAALRLADKAEAMAAKIRQALRNPDLDFLCDLEVESVDGKIVLIEMLSAAS